jgi:hypothetical protein
MSTRSIVAIKKDNIIRFTYCQNDGYQVAGSCLEILKLGLAEHMFREFSTVALPDSQDGFFSLEHVLTPNEFFLDKANGVKSPQDTPYSPYLNHWSLNAPDHHGEIVADRVPVDPTGITAASRLCSFTILLDIDSKTVTEWYANYNDDQFHWDKRTFTIKDTFFRHEGF